MADLFTNMANRILKPTIRASRSAGIDVGSRTPSRKSSGSVIGSTPYRSKRKAKRS